MGGPFSFMTLPFLDLTAPDFSTRSTEVLDARSISWCARTPYGLAVLRHREAGELLRDKRLRQGSYAWPDLQDLKGPFARFWKASVISQEGDTHKRLRRLALAALTPDFVLSLKPAFRRIATELVEDLAGQTTLEFMADFSERFAGRAITELLALPVDDAKQIGSDASALGLAMGVGSKRHEPVFNAACERLMGVAQGLIDRARQGQDQTSFVARLTTKAAQMGDVSDQELLDLIVISIFGGVDTTRAQLGFAVNQFIAHPDQWALLRSEPSLIPQAIEEVIRTQPTTTWATREAVVDFSYKSVDVRAGETLHILVHATGTDPAIAPNFQFDIRQRRTSHFGFGGGAHHCLGQLVARTDMAEALRVLTERIKHLAWNGQPAWLPDSGNTSPAMLPIEIEWARENVGEN